MKVIGAGFWKTGTTSLAKALKILGYNPVYDYTEQYCDIPQLWEKFVNGSVTDDDIRETLKDIDAMVDGPCVAYWEEIMNAIPEAKVILTTRDDEEAWWNSYKRMRTGTPFVHKLFFLMAMFLSPTGNSITRIRSAAGALSFGVERSTAFSFLTHTDNPRMYKNVFRKHNARVLQSVPKEKLLILKLGEGWEPLCKFLGKPIPNFPYPFENKKDSHNQKDGGPKHPAIRRIFLEAAFTFSILIALISILCFFAFG